jgi:ATP-binding cassette, subfamily B, bacterial MsbA
VNLYRPFFKHLRGVRLPFALGLLSGLIYALASAVGMPLMVEGVFPLVFDEPGAADKAHIAWLRRQLGEVERDVLLITACLWIPLVFLVRAVAAYANAYWIQFCGLRVVEEIRLDLFRRLQELPLGFFRRHQSGDLLARLMNDTELLRQVVTQGANDLIRQPATLAGALGYLGYKAWTDRSFFVALIAMVTVPVCVYVIRKAGKKLASRALALQERGGDLSASLAESLQSPLEIRAYNMQERQITLFAGQVRQLLRLSMKVVKYRQAISPSIEVVAALGFAVALFLGVREGMTQSSFMALATALFMCYEPIKKLGMLNSMLKQADASIHRVNGILEATDSLDDPAVPLPFRAPVRSIHFAKLHFAYRSGEDVLHDIDVEIPIGQCVALIGPSGAGKTTFASLVPRFYDPRAGALCFDGVDIRRYAQRDLREAIAVVPQMPALFSGTILENIRIGRPDASDSQVREAARKAHAEDFILGLPEGYETRVGERGDLLSGGQRQRIAIARAFLKDAPILILDEATSALDTESESMIQQALAGLVRGRTTLIIAHRFSTIRVADRILVFQGGRIIADGNHEQLAAGDPTYLAMQAGSGPV